MMILELSANWYTTINTGDHYKSIDPKQSIWEYEFGVNVIWFVAVQLDFISKWQEHRCID